MSLPSLTRSLSSLSHSLTHSPLLPLCSLFCLSFAHAGLSLSLCLCRSLARSLSVSLSLCALSLSRALSLFFTVARSLALSLSVSLCSLSLSLSFTVALSLSRSLFSPHVIVGASELLGCHAAFDRTRERGRRGDGEVGWAGDVTWRCLRAVGSSTAEAQTTVDESTRRENTDVPS